MVPFAGIAKIAACAALPIGGIYFNASPPQRKHVAPDVDLLLTRAEIEAPIPGRDKAQQGGREIKTHSQEQSLINNSRCLVTIEY